MSIDFNALELWGIYNVVAHALTAPSPGIALYDSAVSVSIGCMDLGVGGPIATALHMQRREVLVP